MSSRHRLSIMVGLALAIMSAACARRSARDWASVHDVTPPFLVAQAAEDPAIACDRHGRIALTWVTGDSSGQDLWLSLSSDSGVTFGKPVRLDPRPGSVSSSGENRPLPVFGPGGELLVTWSQRRDSDPMVADLVVSAGRTPGGAFGSPVVVNDDAADQRPDFHGLGATTFLPGGTVFAAWIDHREADRISQTIGPGVTPEASAAAGVSIFYAVSADGGQTWSDNHPLSRRACPCCRPVALGDADGAVAVAYRAAAYTLRGPALAISRDRGASFPVDSVVVVDGSAVGACPADGPALATDASGGGLYAWRSGGSDGGAWIAPWNAGVGLAGTRRPLADDLTGASHPRLARAGDVTFIALEGHPRSESARSVIAVRSLAADGALTPWILLGAEATDGWIAAPDARNALVCWIDRGDGGARLRVARLTRRRG